MKIELKRIEYNPILSEESNAFSADLMIDGIKAGIASNSGNGAPTNYYALDEDGKKLIGQAEAFSKKLPVEIRNALGIKPGTEVTLDSLIDHYVHLEISQKDAEKIRNKVNRAMAGEIVFGVPDKSFRTLSFKVPIDMLLVHPNGHNIMKNIITKRVLPYMAEYEKILNTNIPEHILKDCGLKESQFLMPEARIAKEKKTEKKQGRRI